MNKSIGTVIVKLKPPIVEVLLFAMIYDQSRLIQRKLPIEDITS